MFNNLIEKQRKFFMSGQTKNISYRITQLKKLKQVILQRNHNIMDALNKDFKKPNFETYTTEIFGVIDEINSTIKNLSSWSSPKRVKTPLMFFKSTSRIYYDPYGIVLIIGAWNYPFQLALTPLVGAIGAGNCAIIKPSELSPNTSKIISQIIQECFDEDYCTVVEGGVEDTTMLLNERFDFILFTGSTFVAKIVAQAAAKNLTPVILELGGKSPCIIDKTANIDISARRIVWGKFINAGQTCVAPDYIIIHKDIKDKFLNALKKCINDFYGDLPENSPDFARIINEKHFDRLIALMRSGSIVVGGKTNKNDLFIEPTVLNNVTWNDSVMQEEIFGPILPIIEYKDLSEIISMINEYEKPLALYVFSRNKENIDRILKETSSGGACINTTIMHCANPNLPFGGVGNSGMGNYHGKSSFCAFSHTKSVIDKSLLIDFKLLYPPYKDKIKILKKLFG